MISVPCDKCGESALRLLGGQLVPKEDRPGVTVLCRACAAKDKPSAVEQLNIALTEAIFIAERDPAAAVAWMRVSFLEEDLAKLLPASDPEGEIARRGAVTAAISSQQWARASALVDSYRADPAASETLRAQLLELRTEARRLETPKSVTSEAQPSALKKAAPQ